MSQGNANQNLTRRQYKRLPGAKTVAEYAVPPLLAGFVVSKEPLLTRLSQSHEAVLPLATMLLLAALLHPQLRHYLVVTLCYGVGCLALHDAQRVEQVPLPAALNYDWVDGLRPIGLWLVAGLTAVSGLAETMKPGTIGARRCYFGAAGLYFSGLGIVNWLTFHSWQGVVLCFTGVTAFGGCIMADRVAAAEAMDEPEMPDDEILQQTRDTAHRAALQAKEWRDDLKMQA